MTDQRHERSRYAVQGSHERAAGPTLITMQVDDRPLGFIAIGFALVSLILAPSYFLSPLACLPAVPAVILGFIARGDRPPAPRERRLVIAGAAIVWATCAVLFWY